MIGVVDYEAGNIASISNALEKIGADFAILSDAEKLSQCDGIILPGVGAAPQAIEALRRRGLIPFLRKLDIPFLGICLGMQILFDSSEEGNTPCLGILAGSVKTMNGQVPKVPHMGWNRVDFKLRSPLDRGIETPSYFYFAHSYYAPVIPATVGISDCGVEFSAVIQKDNFFGVQFHPEKSADAGLKLLRNFESLCVSSRR